MNRAINFICLILFFVSNGVISQTTIYTGNISDIQSGDPIIGVSILIKDSSNGTLSDYEGNFSLKASPSDVIVVSYIGYATQEIILTQDPVLNLVMSINSELLDEVVVIGYGTIKKSDLTGSVASIKSEEITSVPTTNAMQALQGKVSGLQILNSSGDPGAAPVVRMRGITTLNDNNPIAVIDGVISDIEAVSLLNPNDIESMEVLKDASSTGIYGSRGAAGVVIVTTKRGVSGENRVSVLVERGIESVANQIDVMNGREFATYINEISPGTYNNLDVLPDTDWQDLIYQSNTAITNANFSISGGSESSNFYFGLGYFNQEGILPKSGLQRYTAKLNSGYQLSDAMEIGLDLSLALSDKDNTPGVINTALRAWPLQTPFQSDGETYAEVVGGNALAAIDFTNSNTDRLRGLGNLYTRIKVLPQLIFNSSVQFDASEAKTKSFIPSYFVAPLQQNEINDLSIRSNSIVNFIFENTLTYDEEIFPGQNLTVLGGYTIQDNKSQFLNGFTEGLLREEPLFWELNAGQNDLERTQSGSTRNTLISYLGRINYSINSKYLFTTTLRYDGSSKFGPNNKWGTFYSFALGWNLHNEAFFPSDGMINRMKLRASYGTIGNERIPGSAQYSLINGGRDGVFGRDQHISPGASFDGGGNPNLKWESTDQFNIGVDFGLLDDKLIAEIDYYQKNTSDILVPLEPIGYTGIGSFRTIFFNAADVKNSGIEWNINYRNNVNDFTYSVGLVGSTLSNEVTNIGQGFGADSLLIGGDLGNGQQVARSAVGFPIGFFYGYEVEGVFQDQNEVENSAILFGQRAGDLKYRDINRDGRINGEDRTKIGTSIPSLLYGLHFELGYKQIKLSGDFQGQSGNDIYNGKQAIRFTTLNYEDKFNDHWTGPGSTNEDPRPTEGGSNFLPSSYYVEDGSFLRLRTLTLEYRLGQNVLNKAHLIKAKIYVRGTNLFTATAFTGYSPEIGADNAINGVIDRGVYPISRIITLGLNANF